MKNNNIDEDNIDLNIYINNINVNYSLANVVNQNR
jgi:hypothetical protein